jgi:MSHA biogenesis protein MshK
MSKIAPVLVLACGLAASAQAAPWADPTRPPGASLGDDPATLEGPRLESVLIAPDRRIAIISGQQYRMGDKYGDGRVVRITESEVAIRTGEALEVLKLLPASEKRLRPRAKGKR